MWNGRGLARVEFSVNVDFFSSAFCEPCMVTRSVLSEAGRLVSAMNVIEHDVVRDETEAERLGIRSTPTVIVRDAAGAEVFRAEGIPSLNQMLVALAKAV
jgi:predicted DsbA family dithiol-disulfide isomerase